MWFDTSFKDNSREINDCSIELEWPLFTECGSPQNDSNLNYITKRKLFSEAVNQKGWTLNEFCENLRGRIFNLFEFKRFDKEFLVIYYYFNHYYRDHGSGPLKTGSILINYDFDKQMFIEIWDLFKSKYNKQEIKDKIKQLSQMNQKTQLLLMPEKFKNLKDKIIAYPTPVTNMEEITLKKETLKKYLKEEYYHE